MTHTGKYYLKDPDMFNHVGELVKFYGCHDLPNTEAIVGIRLIHPVDHRRSSLPGSFEKKPLNGGRAHANFVSQHAPPTLRARQPTSPAPPAPPPRPPQNNGQVNGLENGLRSMSVGGPTSSFPGGQQPRVVGNAAPSRFTYDKSQPGTSQAGSSQLGTSPSENGHQWSPNGYQEDKVLLPMPSPTDKSIVKKIRDTIAGKSKRSHSEKTAGCRPLNGVTSYNRSHSEASGESWDSGFCNGRDSNSFVPRKDISERPPQPIPDGAKLPQHQPIGHLEYARPLDTTVDRSEGLINFLHMSETTGYCKCGIRMSKSVLIEGWTVHRSAEPSSVGKLYFMNESKNLINWELPPEIVKRLSLEMRNMLDELRREPFN